MKKLMLLTIALCLTLSAGKSSTAIDPMVIPSCTVCSVGSVLYISGTGWKPHIDVFAELEGESDPGHMFWSVECGHTDSSGNFYNCGPFSLPQAGTYRVFGGTPFTPGSNLERAPDVFITAQ